MVAPTCRVFLEGARNVEACTCSVESPAGAAVLRDDPCPRIVHKRGTDILHDPWFNKDTGFPVTERDRLGLRGLLPPRGISWNSNMNVLAMQESDSPRPAIFALSNPTKNAECTAVDAFKYAGENIIFASGSPFENVPLGNGKVGYVNQANNMYLFPGIGLGSLLSGAHLITDGMLQAAAECLASYITEEEIRKGILFPSISSIRHITTQVGAAVVHNAVAEELAEGHGNVDLKERMHMSKEER